jgi:hypothetical protein
MGIFLRVMSRFLLANGVVGLLCLVDLMERSMASLIPEGRGSMG